MIIRMAAVFNRKFKKLCAVRPLAEQMKSSLRVICALNELKLSWATHTCPSLGVSRQLSGPQ